jgi:hypothetical protein
MDKIKKVTVHFTDEFVADLKARVGVRCSTFQCLLAHVWKKITAARDLELEEFTQVRVAVNCRARASPAVPTDFFGNMVHCSPCHLFIGSLLVVHSHTPSEYVHAYYPAPNNKQLNQAA